MVKINESLLKMDENNIFKNVSIKVSEYKKNNPNKKIISLGVGDVSKPIVKPIIDAMHEAVDDLSNSKTFKGYGAYYGYDFLKEKIIANEYKDFNFSLDEIYISNGTKTDSTNILELFDINSKICITNPMYPIYRDGAASLSRKVFLLDIKDNLPVIPKEKYDIIYICSPSNPMGIAYNRDYLKKWINYAIKNESIILYDNVYSAFIESEDVPKSIYEIKDSKKVAIEFKSFSKNASFTGVRCSYYIIPKEINDNINDIWKKRTINRFNGADYIAQKGALASFLPESQKLIQDNIKYYKNNAKLLRKAFSNCNFHFIGGIDSPYLWIKIKENKSSWEIFDFFLKKLNIVIIPGIIFGKNGDNYFRISSLGKRKDVIEAIKRIEKYYNEKK